MTMQIKMRPINFSTLLIENSTASNIASRISFHNEHHFQQHFQQWSHRIISLAVNFDRKTNNLIIWLVKGTCYSTMVTDNNNVKFMMTLIETRRVNSSTLFIRNSTLIDIVSRIGWQNGRLF